MLWNIVNCETTPKSGLFEEKTRQSGEGRSYEVTFVSKLWPFENDHTLSLKDHTSRHTKSPIVKYCSVKFLIWADFKDEKNLFLQEWACAAAKCPAQLCLSYPELPWDTLNCPAALLFCRCTEHCYYALAVDSDEREIRANRTQEWHHHEALGLIWCKCHPVPKQAWLICSNCQKRPIFGATCGYLLCVIQGLCQLQLYAMLLHSWTWTNLK